MTKFPPINYFRWSGTTAEASVPLLALARAVFDDFDDRYLLDRLPRLTDPDLWVAAQGNEWVGFKLGYRRGAELLYSWLGGIHPRARRKGIACELLVRQHDHATARGFSRVETRTRAENAAMIMLNLRHGFRIAGFEIDAFGIPVVTQRKQL